jgi:hypothetical protein
MEKLSMKKILISLITTFGLALSLTGCPTPNNANSSASPGASASPGSGTSASGHFSSKTAAIAYFNCIKLKVPAVSAAVDVYISQINNMNDAQFATVSATLDAATKAYAAYGC